MENQDFHHCTAVTGPPPHPVVSMETMWRAVRTHSYSSQPVGCQWKLSGEQQEGPLISQVSEESKWGTWTSIPTLSSESMMTPHFPAKAMSKNQENQGLN